MLSHAHNMPQMVIVNYEIYVALNTEELGSAKVIWNGIGVFEIGKGMLEISVSNVRHDRMVRNLVHLEVKRRFRHVLNLSCQRPQHQK